MKKSRSKSQQKKLRDLAATAYEREMTAASESLLQQFQRWKNKEIDVFELNASIHEFHNGISRTLYNRYTGIHADLAVAIALNADVLRREEVGEELFLEVGGIADVLSFRNQQ